MEEIDKKNDNSQDQMSFTKELKNKIVQPVSVMYNLWIRIVWVPIDCKGADVIPFFEMVTGQNQWAND